MRREIMKKCDICGHKNIKRYYIDEVGEVESYYFCKHCKFEIDFIYGEYDLEPPKLSWRTLLKHRKYKKRYNELYGDNNG